VSARSADGGPATTKRIVIALLGPVRWTPPGVDPDKWRAALAEDVVDLLASLAQADAAIAVRTCDRDLAAALAWPRMPVYALTSPTPAGALQAAATDGYAEAAVLPGDAPDLPGLLVGKLLQPLSTRTLAVAPAYGGGLLGIAARLPAPAWLPDVDLDGGAVDEIRDAAPRRALVAVAPGWHRVRGPDDLRRLDPALEGWPATRALLGG
jgi:hypothetical protein